MLATTGPVLCGAVLGLGTARSAVLVGLDAHTIQVEVSCSRGPSFFQMVGLAETAVRESRVRVASALARIGVLLDEYAITVNLAPAGFRKTGCGLDLAIAVAILVALGKCPKERVDALPLYGELSLDGAVQPIRGVLPLLLGARRDGCTAAVVPRGNAAEAGLVQDMDLRVTEGLPQLLEFLVNGRPLPSAPRTSLGSTAAQGQLDLGEVRGQSGARRALEISAAGNHNLLFVGPPGGGKTLLARLLPTILPALSFDEALEVTAIHSVAGLVNAEAGVVAQRPFRAPHHSVSEPGLVGGGELPRPGEVSLAHHGVLFLDELAEFRRCTLEALRQPLEDGKVQIARVRARTWFPAEPLLVAAVNPCPCGYFGHPTRPCRCSTNQRQRYLSRLSGPLLDRIDLHCAVPPVDIGQLSSKGTSESSETVRARVEAARARQAERHRMGLAEGRTNSRLTLDEAEAVTSLRPDAQRLLTTASQHFGLSARAYVRILRVARTIADLEDAPQVRLPHVAEAIQGRILDRRSAPLGADPDVCSLT